MTTFADMLANALGPVLAASRDPFVLDDLLRRLGIEADLDTAVAESIQVALDIQTDVDAVVVAIEALTDGASTDELLGLIEPTLGLATSLASAPGRLQAIASDIPPVLLEAQTWTQLAADLPMLLVTNALEDTAPWLFGLLLAAEVLSPPDDVTGPVDQRLDVDLGNLIELVTDPGARLSAVFDWEGDFAAELAFYWLRRIGGIVGIPVAIVPVPEQIATTLYGSNNPPLPALQIDLLRVSGAVGGATGNGALGAILAAAPPAGDQAGRPAGLYAGPTIWGSAEADVTIADGLILTTSLQADASGAAGIIVRPQDIQAVSSSANLTGSAHLEWQPADGITLLSGGGVIVSIGGLRLGVTVEGTGSQFAPRLDFAILGDGLTIATDPEAADSFLTSLVGEDFNWALPIAGHLSGDGLSIEGSVGLAIKLPGTIPIGPIELHSIGLELTAGDGAVAVVVSTDVAAELGPFAVAVSDVGADLAIAEASPDNPGGDPLGIGLDIRGGFKPPEAIGFAMEAAGVSGGGFVRFDRELGRYSGALALDAFEIGISALTVVDTRLPDDPSGWAFFASLGINLPAIPLGFGFSLTGLGGLLAINRSIDTDALSIALRGGAADAILFPEDPVQDAPVLIGQIDEYFPLLAGNTVIGPVAEISWGVGNMLVGQIGVLISLPQELIVVLGSIEAILPDPDAPILELHLDTLGAIDLNEGTLLVVASLYDSRLLGIIELSGDAALYVSTGSNPYFLLSVGGYHPGFTPPAHVPPVLHNLRRMRADVDLGAGVTAGIEAYFAVTSNTVQFGGGAEIEASTKFLLVTYTARGWFSFDVLIRFSPFMIMADLSAGVGVFANNKELFGVELGVHLEGPDPWFASGHARFRFFGINVKFNFSVGGHAPPEIRPTTNVLELVAEELRNPESWSAESGSAIPSGLRFSGDDSGLLKPGDVLVGRQTVAPFDRHLARFGETTPDQDEISVDDGSTDLVTVQDGVLGSSIGAVDVDDSLDWFAPSQYDVMSDQARLSAPSYEQMVAGVRIGSLGLGVPTGDHISAPSGHETEIWQPDIKKSVRRPGVTASRPAKDAIAASAGYQAVRAAGAVAVEAAPVKVETSGYVTVDVLTGDRTSTPRAFHEAVALADDNPKLRVVPAQAGMA